ncbi:MAG TPA: DUF2877 domain-containing protein [Anaerolineae bacterium]|nr:DUF2877 domain-containing protein [Anaerolineae bacterium]
MRKVRQVIGRSVSRRVWKQLRQGPSVARVLASFEHACDLITAEGDIVALVTRRVGDGPLNVVVEGAAGLFAEMEAGATARLTGEEIRFSLLTVDLRGATVWEPRPNWGSLRARRAAIVAHLPALRVLCLKCAPPGSLLALLESPSAGGVPRGATIAAARKATGDLQAGWAGDEARLRTGAARLSGLGGGLTPSGDDFLTGVMLWAWLAHPAPGPFCHILVEAAAGLTTTLSAAFLQAAARGECSGAWHRLITALGEGTDAEVAGAAQGVLAHGATSGADGLAGFLWAGLSTDRLRRERS